MPRKDGTLTKMEKRDIRDGVALALSMLGTAVSIASLAITLSPRSDPEGVALAKDVESYLVAHGICGYGVMDLHRALSTPQGVGCVIDAIGAVEVGRDARGLIAELRKRHDDLM